MIFMAHDDCMKYFNDCANGIPIPEQPKAYAEVDLSDRNEPSHEFLRGAVASTLSRCVRAIGVDSDWGMAALMKMAGKGGRKVERVVNGTNPRGVSSLTLVFRIKITDGVLASCRRVPLHEYQ